MAAAARPMVLTDAGLETVLVFEEGLDLPHFAAFPLLDSDEGRVVLRRYYEPFLRLARDRGSAFVLSSPTWRANPDWGELLGYDDKALAELNGRAVAFLEQVRDEVMPAEERDAVVIEGCIGPRSDAYSPTLRMDAASAAEYHGFQLPSVCRCRLRAGVSTDAQLPGGSDRSRSRGSNGRPSDRGQLHRRDRRTVAERRFDRASDPRRGRGNRRHRPLLHDQLRPPQPLRSCGAALKGQARRRIHGLRANASMKSHAELDAAEDLDAGDPTDLARRYVALRRELPELHVLGGCCGTNLSHVTAISRAWQAVN